MFNLEQAIAEWRQQMLAAGIKTPVPLEELESHLRDEIERQLEAGSNQPDAFAAAVRKLGSGHTVHNEFMKVDKTHGALEWRLMEIGLTLVTILIPLLLGGIVLKRASIIDMTATEVLSSLAALAAFSLLAWSGRLSRGIFPVIASQRTRFAIAVSGSLLVALWWVIFLFLIIPYCDLTTSQFLVAFFWANFSPVGAWVGLFWGMEAAARKNFASEDLSAS